MILVAVQMQQENFLTINYANERKCVIGGGLK